MFLKHSAENAAIFFTEKMQLYCINYKPRMGSACSRNNYNQISSNRKKKKKEERVADLDETMEDGNLSESVLIAKAIIQ